MTVLPDYADPDTLFLVDLSGFVYRFWHVGPAFAGRNFAGMLEKIITLRGPARLAIAEDTVFPTFRHDLAGGTYKANRPEKSWNDRASQLEQLRIAGDLAEDVYGVKRFSMKGFEADDVLATLATWGAEEGLKVVILALDKDMMQLVSPSTIMWDGKGPPLGLPEVKTKLGVTPAQVVDYLTIVGDTCDNVSGIKGIGEKGAVALLERFGRLDVALNEANETGEGRGANHPFFAGKPALWAKLVGSRAEAERARALVTLRKDVPLKLTSLDELALV